MKKKLNPNINQYGVSGMARSGLSTPPPPHKT